MITKVSLHSQTNQHKEARSHCTAIFENFFFFLISKKQLYILATSKKRAYQSTHNVYERNQQASKKKRENKQQASSPCLGLGQSTKPIMVNEWSSMYTLTHLKKAPIKEDLIAWSDYSRSSNDTLFLFFHYVQNRQREGPSKLFFGFFPMTDPFQLKCSSYNRVHHTSHIITKRKPAAIYLL